jgi:RimJ/RimL family protein N-acetyltransferase
MLTIDADRLILRSYDLADVPELARLIGAREVAANLLRVPFPYTEQDAKAFITGLEDGGEIRLAITLRADGSLCGGVGLRVASAHERAELGYWLGIPYWGHGYATEASRVLVQHGFETLKLHRICASVFTGNDVSAKVLRKLGMRYEGCLRQHVLKWGRFIDLEMYGLLRTEWQGV